MQTYTLDYRQILLSPESSKILINSANVTYLMRLQELEVILRCKVDIDLRLQGFRVGVQTYTLDYRQILLFLESSIIVTSSTSAAYLMRLQGLEVIVRCKVYIDLRLQGFRVRVQTYTLDYRQILLSSESSKIVTNSTSAAYLMCLQGL